MEYDSINCSSNYYLSDSWKVQEEYIVSGRVAAALLSIFISVGLPWNILVLITIAKEKLYRQPTTILLIVLVTSDIIILAGPAPIVMVTGFTGEYLFGITNKMRCYVCHLEFALLTPLYSSFIVIMFIAVDRLLYIMKPLQYDRLVTARKMTIPLILLLIFSIASCLTLYFVKGEPSFHPEMLVCTINGNQWFYICYTVIGATSLLIVIVCNVIFSFIVLKNIKAVYSGGQYMDKKENKSQSSTRHRKELRLFVMSVALFLASLVSWIPFLSLLVNHYINNDFPESSFSMVAIVAFYSQAVVDPFIETMVLAEVRTPLLTMLTCGLFAKVKKNCEHNKGEQKGCSQFFVVSLVEAALEHHLV